MRADHLTAAEIQRYAARHLTPEAALEISDHLVECAECRALLRQAEQFRPPAAERGYISYEELADLVDDTLDPLTRRELMQKLAASPRARAELEDLAKFKREAAVAAEAERPWRASLWKWSLPLAAAVAAGAAFLWWSVSSPSGAGGFVLRDNGSRVQIAPDGSLIGGPDLPRELRDSLKSALSQNRLFVAADAAALRGERSTLAGPETRDSMRALAPVGTAVAQPLPEFRWTGDDRATGYRITIARAADSQPIGTAEVGKGQLSWRATTALARGEDYVWQVEALQNGNVIATAPAPPQPEARFRVLLAEQAHQLNALKQRVGNSHLALALAYARAGLIDDADSELDALEQENRDSALPGRLRAALRNGVASR